MTAASARDVHVLPVGTAVEAHPPGQWGMLLLIATESALFGCLLFSYFYLGARAPAWPPSGPPELTLASINTVLLLSSSAALHWGERGIRRGHVGRLRAGLALTIVLGAVFLSLQGIEYHRQSLTPATDAYSSAFYTVTGVHGAHVLVGLVVLAVLSVMAARGKFDKADHAYVSNAALYWHFVDAVWLAVFSSLYLAPHLGL